MLYTYFNCFNVLKILYLFISIKTCNNNILILFLLCYWPTDPFDGFTIFRTFFIIRNNFESITFKKYPMYGICTFISNPMDWMCQDEIAQSSNPWGWGCEDKICVNINFLLFTLFTICICFKWSSNLINLYNCNFPCILLFLLLYCIHYYYSLIY